MDGLAATVADAGTQTYDSGSNTITHYYNKKNSVSPKKDKSRIKQKKKD